MTAGDGKPCTKCGTSDWYDTGHCKECTRKRNRNWRKNNPEKARACERAWRENNPHKVKRNHRVRCRRYRRKHADKIRKYKQKWRSKNPGKERAKNRRRRARIAAAQGTGVTEHQWQTIREKYGNRCLRCGSDSDITMDHVVPLSRGGKHDPSNIQPLCHSCNAWKKDKTIDYRTKPLPKRWQQLELLYG